MLAAPPSGKLSRRLANFAAITLDVLMPDDSWQLGGFDN